MLSPLVPTTIDISANPASMAVKTSEAFAGEYPALAREAPIRMLPNP